jgi:hypothetical protein
MPGNNIIQATSISPQVLVSQQLGTSEAALYTVPSGQSVKIAHGVLCNVTALMPSPVLTLGTTATSGGTFAAGTYYWKVSAVNASGGGGETLPSNEVSAVLAANGTQALSWGAVAGAASYNIWRGTTAGGENVLVATVTGTTYTDTGSAGTSRYPNTTSTASASATVHLSVIKSGGTMGDTTHRVICNYSLAGSDSLSLAPYLGGAMLGPGDVIAAYASAAAAVDIVITGTVHS